MKEPDLAAAIFAAAVTLMLALAGSAHANPSAAKMCQGCHGQDGISTRDNTPSIAGISVAVHADYLYAYKEGARVCSDAKTKAMCTMTARLSDEQIEELAEYFAAMKYRPYKQDFDAAKAAAGAAIHEEHCSKCHTEGGSNPQDEASILAGQPLAYLKLSLQQFATEKREQPEAMQRKIAGLSEADIEALAHYYASQQ